jgi:hypothetical protein
MRRRFNYFIPLKGLTWVRSVLFVSIGVLLLSACSTPTLVEIARRRQATADDVKSNANIKDDVRVKNSITDWDVLNFADEVKRKLANRSSFHQGAGYGSAATQATLGALADAARTVGLGSKRTKIRNQCVLHCSAGILESGWGTSRISHVKNNLFGWNAFDSNRDLAKGFDSRAQCIDFVMGRVNALYLDPKGHYFVDRPCVGNRQIGMNVKLCGGAGLGCYDSPDSKRYGQSHRRRRLQSHRSRPR